MTTRKVLNHCIRLASAFAVLAALLVSPLRLSKLGDSFSSRDYIHREFVIPKGHSHHHLPVKLVGSTKAIKALPSESRKKPSRTTRPDAPLFDPPFISSPKTDWDPVAFLFDRLTHPLRC
jgi:hypothetical protein